MQIATLLDYLSYSMFAVTLGLIGFKTLELWAPQWLGQTSVSNLMTQPSAEVEHQLEDWERGLVVLSVIASTAPFIGLMGTVLHIITALSKVSTSLDTAIISGPIATALNATLVGLASAVPAAGSHALFCRRLDLLRLRFSRTRSSV